MPRKSIDDIEIPTYDDLFTSEEQRQESKLEKIMNIPISEIHEFENHPFKIRMDEDMLKLVDSINENGVLHPALVRPSPSGQGYEMVSGHRRMKATELNGLNEIPAIVRDLSDEQATILMVDSNIQRERILPSERGFAYKMKLNAMKHQGKRNDLTSMQVAQKLKGRKYSVELLGEEVGESKDQIRRFIRLTELIEPLRDLVDGIREDKKKIALNPAVELSYLSNEHQEIVIKYIDELNITPSHAQAIRMKELSRENRLDENVIYSIISEEKPNQKEKLSIKMEDIDKYFPRGFTPKEKEKVILKLLDGWAKKRNKEHER
ncbi:ParB/RepB/Spo0J family partition protein [Candidatus Stoquefichus massiliensis]|uniref:ParB/RepB/Spo0J family partition protein n=1 Tax=Candidatus Stoquefichus massiliensis TaxID=1470350 RepID=UPI000484F5B6|nr:ParB/RepB/Spo0J family partition protein [Candidatus Stoquefichus massiliensis]